ncbi:T3SS effector HopA1 family protein [Streptomyces sp. PKU-MA01144]|uniref:T3SS effector HopA1 family protein n=1 Tax=Streptomyces sp. PKU-MA01144 TaxID=2729138 RepID=UPI001BB1B84A|nr:T3SS effector HopA1 family protein [Streptomyces sp. PKU-MA01144]
MTSICPHGRLSARLCESLEDVRIQPGRRWSATVRDRTITQESAAALRAPLIRTLYDVLHAGRREGTSRSRSLRDARLEAQFAEATPHRTTIAQARIVEAANGPREAIVEVSGVRVSAPAGTIGAPEGASGAGATVTVALPAARPAVSPGFFLADGSLGRPGHSPLLRVYVNIADPDDAPAAWHQALSRLEEKRIRYRAKILSTPRSYPRTDSMVIYLGADAWHLAAGLPRMLGRLPGTGSATSVFARQLAPGIAMAWEPADDRLGHTHLSYGQHRSAALTDALIRHADTQGTPTLDALVHEALIEAGVDPLAPERNTDSPELELAR